MKENVSVNSDSVVDRWGMLKMLRCGRVVEVGDKVCKVVQFNIHKSPDEMPVEFKDLATGYQFLGHLHEITGVMLPVEFKRLSNENADDAAGPPGLRQSPVG